MLLLILSLACTARPGGSPSINGDAENDWPSLPDVDDEITMIMEQDAIAGLATCLVSEGRTVWCGAYGERDVDQGLLVTPQTPFMLASVSKAVTAVAVQQVVENGTLNLDADVNTLVDFSVVHADGGEPAITGRHLTAHVSGITDNWDVLDAHYVDGDSTEELGAFLESYLDPAGEDYSASKNYSSDGVGKVHDYSNLGTALAGYLVEAASGTPFDDHCDARIFQPLGMNAAWHLSDFNEADVAVPTEVVGGRFQTMPHYGFPDYPNGQLRADAVSMASFVAMVAEGGTLNGAEVLSSQSVAALKTASYPEIDDTQGLFWYSWKINGDKVWGHNGGDFGASTEIIIRESDNVAVVVLMNSEGTDWTLEDVEIAVLDGLSEI